LYVRVLHCMKVQGQCKTVGVFHFFENDDEHDSQFVEADVAFAQSHSTAFMNILILQ